MLSDPHDPNLTADQPFWDESVNGPLPPGAVINLDSTDTNALRLSLPAMIIFVVASITVLVRVHSRVYLQKVKLSWDDYLCLIAWSFQLVTTVAYGKMTEYGWGKHIWDINALEASYLSFWIWLANFYFLSVFFSKMSILALYLRIFHQSKRWFTWSVYVLAFLNTAGCMIGFWGSIGLPRPAAAWNPTTMKPVDGSNLWYFQQTASGVNIAVDVLMIILPIPIVMKLHAPQGQRIAVVGVFMAAMIATVFSGLRFWSMRVSASKTVPDFTRELSTQGVLIFGSIESNLYLMCACLPVIKTITVAAFSKAVSTRYVQASVYTSKLWLSGRSKKSTETSSSLPPSRPLHGSHQFGHTTDNSKASEKTLADHHPHNVAPWEKQEPYDMV